jgi:hypothetical protein
MSGTTLPVVFDANGLQPQAVASLRDQIVTQAVAQSPGIVTNLPGSLIEDLTSTSVGAVAVIDQMRVDLVNSLTPYGANPFLLNQLGQVYGVPRGLATNTGVSVIFSGTPGFTIPPGFIIGDGTYQYSVQDGGQIGAPLVIGQGGQSPTITAIATQTGSWAVPAGTVTKLITSVPSTVTLTVTNPLNGTPGAGAQTEEDYRSCVLQAGLVASQGMTTTLKTALTNIVGVQPRLVTIRQQLGGGWEVICGGSGDPYLIGKAIFDSLFDISILSGSVMLISGVTNASPGVVTTALNHGLATGQVINITGATGMTILNSAPLTITVLTPTTFSIGINTISSGTYTGGGVVSPNFRNISVSIYDYPDVYIIPFVLPPQQIVTMVVNWNTNFGGFVSATTVATQVQNAVTNYINSIPVGQPINVFELEAAFRGSIANLFSPSLLTRMVFNVSINGVGVSPSIGTGIIAGDPESYFFTTAGSITVIQG